MQLVTDWMGANGRLLRMNYQCRAMAIAGDVLTCKGKVKEKKEKEDKGLVYADVWIENQRGEVPTRAEVTIQLPRRSA